MPITIEQRFPLGRFHATRWRENIFEDKYGEWPPSPWRLLRALASRWIQYCRETGDDEIERRDRLLRILASELPAYRLPEETWRPSNIPRQYHRTGIEWTAKGKKDSAYRKAMATLVPDPYRVICPTDCVLWFWHSLELDNTTLSLLHELTRRVTYFGRAESFCHMRVLHTRPEQVPNCQLTDVRGYGQPVLVPAINEPLNIDALLAATDSKETYGIKSPPSATWRYAKLPKSSRLSITRPLRQEYNENTNILQFAVGGRVYPGLEDWVRVTQRFRGRVLKNIASQVSNGAIINFADLSTNERQLFSQISGKDGRGHPLQDHSHPYFALLPDENGHPTRLVCYRKTPFASEEVAAILAAAEHPISWQFERRNARKSPWQLRLVPLPSQVPILPAFNSTCVSATWISETPFVPQGNRHRFRKNGKLRPSESPERLLEKLLAHRGLIASRIERLQGPDNWVAIHETALERSLRESTKSRNSRQGFRFRICFEMPIEGPIILGHSAHFGLGIFAPV